MTKICKECGCELEREPIIMGENDVEWFCPNCDNCDEDTPEGEKETNN